MEQLALLVRRATGAMVAKPRLPVPQADTVQEERRVSARTVPPVHTVRQRRTSHKLAVPANIASLLQFPARTVPPATVVTTPPISLLAALTIASIQV
jgi:hypothetical protein